MGSQTPWHLVATLWWDLVIDFDEKNREEEAEDTIVDDVFVEGL